MSEPIGARRYGTGGGDAYYDAVKYGRYQGTREQFGQDQAKFAENAAAVAEAKEIVEQDTQEVRGKLEQFDEITLPATIQAVQNEGSAQIQAVRQQGQTSSDQVMAVGTAQKDAVANEGRARVQAVTDEGSTQVQRVQAVSTGTVEAVAAEGNRQIDLVGTEGATQVQAVADEGTEQVGAVNTAGQTQVQNVQDAGQEVINSIPADYTELAGDVSDLKSAVQRRGVDEFSLNNKAYADYVRLSKLEINSTPLNLFDKNSVIENKKILNNGSLANDNGYKCSVFMRVYDAEKLVFYYLRSDNVSPQNNNFCAFYDANFSLVGSVLIGNSSVTVPSGAVYFRIAFSNSTVGSAMVFGIPSDGTYTPSAYVPFMDGEVNGYTALAGIQLLAYANSNYGIPQTATADAKSRTVLTFDGTGEFPNAYSWAHVQIKHTKSSGKLFTWNKVLLKWTGDSDYTDVTAKASCFVNTSLSFTGARTLNKSEIYNVDEVSEGYGQKATIFLGIGFDATFDPTHIYKVDGSWHFDAFTVVLDGYLFNQNDIHFSSVVAQQLSNGLTGAQIDNRLGALEEAIPASDKYITCWGDSLTAMGGWTTRLETLTGITVHNCGIGGEGMDTVTARQGGDAFVVEGITIPADTTEVLFATYAEGFKTQMGQTGLKPLLQGGSSAFNPCRVGDIEGTLRWTGASYSDQTGTWVFSRSVAGEAHAITRPEAIVTKSDIEWNAPYLMTIFMGQNNFGFNNNNEITTVISEANIKKCIKLHRWIIEHAKEQNFVVLGLGTGTAASNADYEAAMKEEFGRYFISIREYLAHPVYEGSSVVNCYGLQDLGLTATSADLTDISNGKAPSRCFTDGVHIAVNLRPFIGDYIYKRCKELNIFKD